MTILTIDIGNTKTKVTVFCANLLKRHKTFNKVEEQDISMIIRDYPEISKAMVSSVDKEEEKRVVELLNKEDIENFTLSHTTRLPFEIDYHTPETLGKDRIAAMAGAYSLNGEGDYLIIDIGTCITYDLLINNHFIGGNIAPGLQMRLDAMHQFTASLPKVELKEPENELGLSTQEAILNGAYWGVTNEIKSIISRYKKEYMDITVVITGGGAESICEELGLTSEPMLVPMGLNFLANDLSK